ncbi:unnamed protein product, partial [Polarella glacialis]
EEETDSQCQVTHLDLRYNAHGKQFAISNTTNNNNSSNNNSNNNSNNTTNNNKNNNNNSNNNNNNSAPEKLALSLSAEAAGRALVVAPGHLCFLVGREPEVVFEVVAVKLWSAHIELRTVGGAAHDVSTLVSVESLRCCFGVASAEDSSEDWKLSTLLESMSADFGLHCALPAGALRHQFFAAPNKQGLYIACGELFASSTPKLMAAGLYIAYGEVFADSNPKLMAGCCQLVVIFTVLAGFCIAYSELVHCLRRVIRKLNAKADGRLPFNQMKPRTAGLYIVCGELFANSKPQLMAVFLSIEYSETQLQVGLHIACGECCCQLVALFIVLAGFCIAYSELVHCLRRVIRKLNAKADGRLPFNQMKQRRLVHCLRRVIRKLNAKADGRFPFDPIKQRAVAGFDIACGLYIAYGEVFADSNPKLMAGCCQLVALFTVLAGFCTACSELLASTLVHCLRRVIRKLNAKADGRLPVNQMKQRTIAGLYIACGELFANSKPQLMAVFLSIEYSETQLQVGLHIACGELLSACSPFYSASRLSHCRLVHCLRRVIRKLNAEADGRLPFHPIKQRAVAGFDIACGLYIAYGEVFASSTPKLLLSACSSFYSAGRPFHCLQRVGLYIACGELLASLTPKLMAVFLFNQMKQRTAKTVVFKRFLLTLPAASYSQAQRHS